MQNEQDSRYWTREWARGRAGVSMMLDFKQKSNDQMKNESGFRWWTRGWARERANVSMMLDILKVMIEGMMNTISIRGRVGGPGNGPVHP